MKLKYDKLLSNFAFNCNLRHHTAVPPAFIAGVAIAGLSAAELWVAWVGHTVHVEY